MEWFVSLFKPPIPTAQLLFLIVKPVWSHFYSILSRPFLRAFAACLEAGPKCEFLPLSVTDVIVFHLLVPSVVSPAKRNLPSLFSNL